MKYITNSSAIISFELNEEENILYVEFPNKKIYSYCNVYKEDFFKLKEIDETSSLGSYFTKIFGPNHQC